MTTETDYTEESIEDFEDEIEIEDSPIEAILEVRDELSVQSELLEKIADSLAEKLKQDAVFNEQLIETLKVLANK
ncbi:MAG TPA: hypothetical protein V6C96_00785 [Vampirovibrionales bacterium]